MIKIEIKEVKTATGEEVDYMELCHACLKAPAPGGFTASMMELRLKALSEFPVVPRTPGKPKAPPVVKFVNVSTEVYAELKGCVAAFRWGVVDQVFLDFVKYIQKIGDVTPIAKKKK